MTQLEQRKEDGAVTTITLRKNTKARLESIKGKKDWSSFLDELYSEKRKKAGKKSLSKLRELLSDEDLDRISASSKRFRKEFRLS